MHQKNVSSFIFTQIEHNNECVVKLLLSGPIVSGQPLLSGHWLKSEFSFIS